MPDAPVRANPRVEAIEAIRERLVESMEVMPAGPQEGLRFVTEGSIEDAFDAPLPPISDYSAEVKTNATVYVTAVCPQCREAAPIRMEVGTTLAIDDDGRQLRLKAKSRAVSHTCGQMKMLARLNEKGDTAFTLEDIIGTPDDDSEPGAT